MEVVFLEVKVVFMGYTGFGDSSLIPRRVTLSTLEQPVIVMIVNGRIREWLRQKLRIQPTTRGGLLRSASWQTSLS
ncbi:hypothetical protein CY34DRAFT_813223 [Suillus luteus UH-Slu-Lm8-n1]|uniref:Unplaced genomic scaffold CY34scaffold_698, whole genome shotgun sequence n=1 Tax=Suillus luteus UH-Slu-Lm8-n1 TaxID=930992 RepID=A0A0D0A780_9AGAM|nr:hypothetical protein CY34DRAFT_813223 [Suillus luteus UH-Slu-Lm8-n1]